MKNLGRVLILLGLFINTLFASVVASVDSKTVVQGEMVTLSLKLDGEDIKPPNIQSICGEDVISTSSQTSIEMINGDFRKKYVLSYKFLPQKTCEIEPIEIEIGTKKEYTQRIKIDVEAQVITKDSPFILSIEASKEELFVGETFELTLLFKQRNNATAVDSEFVAPNLQGFWIKSEAKPIRFKDDNYTTTKMVYTMAPQRQGDLKISPAQMKIATRSHSRDSWGSWIPQIKWQTFFSNELILTAKKLPSGVDLVGKFSIDAKVDKTSIISNEAINLEIVVRGTGNLEDIKTFKPTIEDVSVFDEKIEINKEVLTQKIAFVSEKDFVIPSMSLRYFDPSTKTIHTIQTKAFKIEVKGKKVQEQPLRIKREDTNHLDAMNDTKASFAVSLVGGILLFILGLIIGVVVMLFKPRFSISKKNLFDPKDEKKLLIRLLEFQEDEEVKEMIAKLEANLYSSEKQVIHKKDLKSLLKRLGIS